MNQIDVSKLSRVEILEIIAERDNLIDAIKKARHKLRSTQRNWDEECLFEADIIMSKALGDLNEPEA